MKNFVKIALLTLIAFFTGGLVQPPNAHTSTAREEAFDLQILLTSSGKDHVQVMIRNLTAQRIENFYVGCPPPKRGESSEAVSPCPVSLTPALSLEPGGITAVVIPSQSQRNLIFYQSLCDPYGVKYSLHLKTRR